jgi:nickel-dependent lactate racemase
MPKIAFGAEEIEFDLEPEDSLTEREPDDADRAWTPESLRQALNAIHFGGQVAGGKVLIVVNDAFRPRPTGQVLSLLFDWYPRLQADFIVACGNHAAPDEADLAAIFDGFDFPADSVIHIHDSRDYDSMVPVGELDGFPLYVNRGLFEYPAVVIIGSVEPHYFAGFTGGRKSLVPGLCDVESITRNHALAVSDEARPLRLAGNPMAEHLDRLVRLVTVPNLVSIQIVAGRRGKILGCFAGDLEQSFQEAVTLAGEVYSFAADRRYDLVIAEMRPPLDRNLYQLQKGIENVAGAVRDGGAVVAVSRCSEGIGNDEFYQLALKLTNTEMVLSHADMEHPPLGIHKLSRIVRMAERIHVRALTGLKQEIVEQVFIEPAVSIEAEIQKLKQADKKKVDILLVREAGLLAAKVD